MFREERRAAIYNIILTNGRVTVKELSDQLEVSSETIRKDLDYLESMGSIKRSFGGAILTGEDASGAQPAAHIDPSFLNRMSINLDKKTAIARAAAQLIAPQDTIIIDSSTTTLQMIQFLPDDKNITVITNSYTVITQLLKRDGISILATGGSLRRKSTSFLGQSTIHSLDNYNASRAFISGQALSLSRGLMDPHEDEVAVKQKFLSISHTACLLVDSSKFAQLSTITTCPIQRFSAIVTDSQILPETAQAIRDLGIQLIIA